MSVVQRSDFPALMQDGLRLLWEENSVGRDEYLNKIFNIETSSKMFETSMGMVSLGLTPRKPETTRVRYDTPRTGRPVTYVHNTFALATAISKEAKDDDRSGQLGRKMVPELAESMYVTREMDAASLFNNGWSYVGYEPDGVAMFSTAHPVLRAIGSTTTYSNRNATDAALGIATLQAARATLWRTISESGKIRPLKAKYLVVPPELESLAEELTMSSLKPGNIGSTAVNDVNVMKGKLEIIVWPYLTDVDAWFLLSDQTTLKWYNREIPNFDTDYDFQSDVLFSKSRARWSRGFDDARGLFGSRGPA